MIVDGQEIKLQDYNPPRIDLIELAEIFGIQAFQPEDAPSYQEGEAVRGYRTFYEDDKGYLHSPTKWDTGIPFQKESINVGDFYYWHDKEVAQSYTALLLTEFARQGTLEETGKFVVYPIEGRATHKKIDGIMQLDEGLRVSEFRISGEPVMSIEMQEMHRLHMKNPKWS